MLAAKRCAAPRADEAMMVGLVANNGLRSPAPPRSRSLSYMGERCAQARYGSASWAALRSHSFAASSWPSASVSQQSVIAGTWRCSRAWCNDASADTASSLSPARAAMQASSTACSGPQACEWGLKGSVGWGARESRGVLRCAQDDGRDKQRQRQKRIPFGNDKQEGQATAKAEADSLRE